MKKTISKLNQLGKNLHTMKILKIDKKTKSLLKREGKKWIKFIEFDMTPDPVDPDDYGALMDNWYHKGEISFIEFFFGIKHKKEKASRVKKEIVRRKTKRRIIKR